MKIIIISLLSIISLTQIQAQRYFSKSANVSFYSEAPLEKIEAVNSKGTCVIDFGNGQMEFAVLIKAFQFEKALMQEHFNENYMESGKYPKSTFKGSIADVQSVNLKKDGTYPVQVSGKLEIHGVTKDIQVPATIMVKNGSVSAESSFSVAVADYGIEIPSVVRENIAKIVDISLKADLEPLNK